MMARNDAGSLVRPARMATAHILNLLCFWGIADIAGLGSRSVTAAISLLHHGFVAAEGLTRSELKIDLPRVMPVSGE